MFCGVSFPSHSRASEVICILPNKCRDLRSLTSDLIWILCINLLLIVQIPVVTICTTSLTLKNSTFCPHTVYLCVLCRSQYKWPLFLYTILTDWFYNRDLTIYRPVVTICTTSSTFKNSTFCPHSVFMCFVCISEQTAITSLYNFNWLVFVTQTQCVYCAVRTGTSNVIQIISAL